MAAHPPDVICDLEGKAKLCKQVAMYVGQLAHEANQHRTHDGGSCADAQKLEVCVARKRALRKQLGKEEVVGGVGGGAKVKGTTAARANGSGSQGSAVAGVGKGGARRRRRSVADLRCRSESKRQFEAFVAGHEARVESAKLRAASESCSNRPSATDRLRLLRVRVAAREAASSACTGPAE